MVIGGLLGAFIGTVVHMLGLFAWVDVSSVIIVSMVSFFGATAKTPISSIVMGSELTGGYALLAPMMLATFIAYIMSGQRNSIFRNQVISRSDSPAHRKEYQIPILKELYVKDIFRKSFTKLSSENSIDEALQTMNRDGTKFAAVVNENDRLLGVANRHKFFEFPEEYRKSVKLDSVMIKDPFFAYLTDSLHSALVRLSSNEIQEMPVLSREDNKVLGIVTISDLVKLYDKEVEKVIKIRKDNGRMLPSVDDMESFNEGSNHSQKKQ
jgi:chloride channel protein, CIC family